MRPVSSVVVALIIGLVTVSMAGCAPPAQKQRVDVSNPILAQYAVAPPIDRAAYGLRPPPSSGQVIIEKQTESGAKQAGYDVMLHYYRRGFTKTIALRKRGERWIWLGEQDGHTGPREYDSADGRFKEQLFVGYHVVSMSGTLRGSHVDYFGDDENLQGELPTSVVEPVLRAWRLESVNGSE